MSGEGGLMFMVLKKLRTLMTSFLLAFGVAMLDFLFYEEAPIDDLLETSIEALFF